MKVACRFSLLSFSALMLMLSSAPAFTWAAEPKVELKAASFEALHQAIAAHKGKVVVVDVWADFCTPCKQKFPEMVKMYKQLAPKGLVLISLTIDEADDKPAALEFLKKMNATFENYWLDDTEANKEKWHEKFRIIGPPVVHVFNRKGERVKTFAADQPFKTADVEQFVKQLLEEK